MKKGNFLILFFFLTGTIYSQDILKVSDKAPKINITDYILNKPEDSKIDNKFIILEFWATWCAPCLGSVPHLNDLQSKFKNRKDLLFISLTYEKPEKTKRTLEKVEFKTIVVSDQTKQTETNFNVDGIPHTVLIDNKGIVKWIGTPNELKSSMIENLLNGKNIMDSNDGIKTLQSQSIDKEKEETESNTDIALRFLKDKNTKFIFSLINANKNDYTMSINALALGKFIDLNNNLKSILSKIILKPESQIVIKDKLLENNYNLIYKNSNKNELDGHVKILKNNLLSSLNVTESIELKKLEVYNLKVKNPKKLNISIEENSEPSHNSDNDTHFVFSNSKIETLIKEIGDYHKMIIFNETGLKDSLDFIIRKGNLKELNNDLEDYGLILEKVVKEIEFFNYK